MKFLYKFLFFVSFLNILLLNNTSYAGVISGPDLGTTSGNVVTYGSNSKSVTDSSINITNVAQQTNTIYYLPIDTNNLLGITYNQIPGAGFVAGSTNRFTWNNNFAFIDDNFSIVTGAYTNLVGNRTNTLAFSPDIGGWFMMTNATSDLPNGTAPYFFQSPDTFITPEGNYWQVNVFTGSNFFTAAAFTNQFVPNLNSNINISPSQIIPIGQLSANELYLDAPVGHGILMFGQAMYNNFFINDQADGWSEGDDGGIEMAWLTDGTFYISDPSLQSLHWVGSGIIQSGVHRAGTNYLGNFQISCAAPTFGSDVFRMYNDFGNSQQVVPFEIQAKNSGLYSWHLYSVIHGSSPISSIKMDLTNSSYPIIFSNCISIYPTNYDPSGWSVIHGCVFIKYSNNCAFAISDTGTNLAYKIAP